MAECEDCGFEHIDFARARVLAKGYIATLAPMIDAGVMNEGEFSAFYDQLQALAQLTSNVARRHITEGLERDFNGG